MKKYNYGTNNLKNRQEWVEKTLQSLTEGTRLLDVGAGECQYKKFCGHLNYVSQDVSEYDGQGDTTGLQTKQWDTSQIDIVCDIAEFPDDKGPFDAILCTEVIEHVTNPVEAVEKMMSLLKPGGHLILTAPFTSLTHFAPYHYCTGFNRYFYEHYCQKNNFKIIELQENGNYFSLVAQELNRIASIAAKKYGKIIGGLLYGFFILPLLLVIKYMSSNNAIEHPEKLGCYGYHLHAVKKQ